MNNTADCNGNPNHNQFQALNLLKTQPLFKGNDIPEVTLNNIAILSQATRKNDHSQVR